MRKMMKKIAFNRAVEDTVAYISILEIVDDKVESVPGKLNASSRMNHPMNTA